MAKRRRRRKPPARGTTKFLQSDTIRVRLQKRDSTAWQAIVDAREDDTRPWGVVAKTGSCISKGSALKRGERLACKLTAQVEAAIAAMSEDERKALAAEMTTTSGLGSVIDAIHRPLASVDLNILTPGDDDAALQVRLSPIQRILQFIKDWVVGRQDKCS